MNLYEGLFLLDSNLASKDWPGLEKHIQDIISKQSGEILHAEKWPDRRLAYEVKGCKKGTYFLVYFNAPSTAIDLMHKDIQLSERILRVLFINEPGLEEEMERRKNKEIDAPPQNLFLDDHRGGHGGGDRHHRRNVHHDRRPRTDDQGARRDAAAASTAVKVEKPDGGDIAKAAEGENN